MAQNPEDVVIEMFIPYLQRDGFTNVDIKNIGGIVPWALKRFLISILRELVQYKKKYKVMNLALLEDRKLCTVCPPVVSEVVYTSNRITAKDFFECLKAHPELIPVHSMYQATVERVMHKIELAEAKRNMHVEMHKK